MEDRYTIEHLDLMNKLDGLLEKILEHFDWNMDDERINEEIRQYAEFSNNMEAGEFPSSAWMQYDHKSTLEDLISLANADIEKYNIK